MSTLQVQTLQGPTSGANSNTVLIPSNNKLYAKGHVVQTDTFTVPATSFSAVNQNDSFTAWSRAFTPLFADSIIVVTAGAVSLVASGLGGGDASPTLKAKLIAYRASDSVALATMSVYENQQRQSSFCSETLFGVYQCTSLTPLSLQANMFNGNNGGAGVVMLYSNELGSVLIQEIAQ